MCSVILEHPKERYLVGLVSNQKRAHEIALQFIVRNLISNPDSLGVISSDEWEENALLRYLFSKLKEKGFNCVKDNSLITIKWGTKKGFIMLHTVHQGSRQIRGRVFGWAVIGDSYQRTPLEVDDRVKCQKTGNPQILSFQYMPAETAVVL